MTTCAECLAVLSTTRLADITNDAAISGHINTCPRCSRLVTDMQFAEQRLALSLSSSFPSMPPTQLAAEAMTGSERMRRQSVARWIRRGLSFTAALLFVIFLRTDTGARLIGADESVRVIVKLKCISPEAAMDLASPLLRGRGSMVSRAKDLNIITVQGQAKEVAQALAQINQIDSPDRCATPRPPAGTTIPADGKPGKD
jgi:hypothetical protein